MTDASDIIDKLAHIPSGSALAELRQQRPNITQYAQGSYLALLEPEEPAGVSRREREMIALRVAVLTRTAALRAWHRDRLHALGVSAAALDAIERSPLGEPLTKREQALLRHTDRVTLSPATATRAYLDELIAGGFEPRDIVTIAQLIGFLSFQTRTLAGLRVLAEEI